jgi:hypothetical protein
MIPHHLVESRRVEMSGRQFILSKPIVYRGTKLPRSFVVQHQAEREGEDFIGHARLVARDRATYGAWMILVYSIYPLRCPNYG